MTTRTARQELPAAYTSMVTDGNLFAAAADEPEAACSPQHERDGTPDTALYHHLQEGDPRSSLEGGCCPCDIRPGPHRHQIHTRLPALVQPGVLAQPCAEPPIHCRIQDHHAGRSCVPAGSKYCPSQAGVGQPCMMPIVSAFLSGSAGVMGTGTSGWR